MIQLTPTAAEKVKQLLAKENNPGLGLRVGVRAGGCSGFSYLLGFDTPHEEDEVKEVDGFKVFLDPQSKLYLDGTTLDYVEGLQESGFKFTNPKAARSCGCGESFSV